MRDNTRELIFVTRSTEYWGAERSLTSLAACLSSIGYRVTVISPENDGFRKALLGTEVSHETVAASQSRLGQAAAMVFRQCQKRRAVFVFFDAECLAYALPLKPLHKIFGNKLMLDLHDVYPTSGGRCKLRLVTAFADGVVGVSNYVLAQAAQRTPKRKCVRPMQATGRRRTAAAQFTVGIIGRVAEDKCVDQVFVLSRLTDQSIRYEIRGGPDSTSLKYYQNLQDKANMPEFANVSFVGPVDRDRLYDGISVLVLLNATEPSGRVVAEAQMVGCPPVVPDNGGAPEYVVNGETGFVYRTGDLGSLAALIDHLNADGIDERIERQCLEASRQTYDARYCVEYYAKAVTS